MKKNEIFFADNGLTSSNANHIGNIAKEIISEIQSKIDNIRFVGCSVNILSSTGQTVIEKPSELALLESVSEGLNQIGQLTALISWLREGIKAKESELSSLPRNYNDYSKLIGKGMIISPYKEDRVTEDDVIGELSIKDRSHYYELEAKASVIGKYIHPDGKFSLARKTLKDKLRNPINIQGQGIDAMVRTYTPAFDVKSVDEKFFQLQQMHRSLQAELNGIKYSIKKETEERNARIDAEYNKIYLEYSNKVQALANEFDLYIKSERARIESLKIVIPNDLKPIYEFVNSMGK